MHRLRNSIVVAVALWLTACSTVSGGAPANSSPTPPSGTVMVAQTSDRQTVTAHVGDHLQIALGEQNQWTLDPPDGVVLTRPVQNYLLVRGTQAIWLASAVGRATIRAVGTAVCTGNQPCPQFASQFTATVVVQ